ncbi:hypothetical protein [Sphingomonas endophytica]|uniref:Uncharacterized protein n=1 Tax=Sphingomonas endophytica TaxID=869719 RepID=A0A147I8I4_9SPHN|nr:hypothetical protein [Sphingomonas endophytica]KTT75346.1 hypothetical protein NS334_03625 [Sphingomonas endophytica]
MRRVLSGMVFVVVAVAVGKACQYAAVGWLGGRLGFAGASLVGLAPFFAVLLTIRARYRRAG